MFRRRPERKISPLEKTYLDRPKHQKIEPATIAFILGALILIGIIYLALITPDIINYLVQRIQGMDIGMTKYEINGVTYDTKEITLNLFRNNLSQYQPK